MEHPHRCYPPAPRRFQLQSHADSLKLLINRKTARHRKPPNLFKPHRTTRASPALHPQPWTSSKVHSPPPPSSTSSTLSKLTPPPSSLRPPSLRPLPQLLRALRDLPPPPPALPPTLPILLLHLPLPLPLPPRAPLLLHPPIPPHRHALPPHPRPHRPRSHHLSESPGYAAAHDYVLDLLGDEARAVGGGGGDGGVCVQQGGGADGGGCRVGGGVVRGAGRGGPEGGAAEGAREEGPGKESGEEDAEGEDEGGGVVIRFTSTLQEEAYTYGACT